MNNVSTDIKGVSTIQNNDKTFQCTLQMAMPQIFTIIYHGQSGAAISLT